MRDPDVLSFEAWRDAWQAIGADGGDGDTHRQLLTRYAEPQRHYHTAQHLAECFDRLHDAMSEARHPGEVLVALWFHDAVYDPTRHDNEQQSADWARDAILNAGLASEVAARVHLLVMATRHDAVPLDQDARLVVDVDLSILGAPAARFDEYERQVREEYRWVPGILFRRTRRTILEQFLERPRIYQTAHFFERYETLARGNLTRSLDALSA